MNLVLRYLFLSPLKFYKELNGWLGLNQVLYASCRKCGEHHHIKTVSGPNYRNLENIDNKPIVNGRFVTACINCGLKNEKFMYFRKIT